jgi:hypothetical protein
MPETFEIESHGVKMTVEELVIPGRVGFRVVFSSKRQPIVIVRATNSKGVKFWTTVPENIDRQIEAEGVGKLIQEYLKSR